MWSWSCFFIVKFMKKPLTFWIIKLYNGLFLVLQWQSTNWKPRPRPPWCWWHNQPLMAASSIPKVNEPRLRKLWLYSDQLMILCLALPMMMTLSVCTERSDHHRLKWFKTILSTTPPRINQHFSGWVGSKIQGWTEVHPVWQPTAECICWAM